MKLRRKGFFPLQEIAKKYDQVPRTLREWVRTKKIDGKKIGRDLWISEKEFKNHKYGSFDEYLKGDLE